MRGCPSRVIACPVEGCMSIGPAVDGEHEHFPTCPLMRINCMKCRLPVRVTKLPTQDCLKERKPGLESMQVTEPNSIPSSAMIQPQALLLAMRGASDFTQPEAETHLDTVMQILIEVMKHLAQEIVLERRPTSFLDSNNFIRWPFNLLRV